jgi:hypothetical protein
MRGEDDIVLTDRERQLLAAIEAAAVQEDPALDGRLRHGCRRARRRVLMKLAAGAGLVVAGALVLVLSSAASAPVVVVATVLQVGGLVALVQYGISCRQPGR